MDAETACAACTSTRAARTGSINSRRAEAFGTVHLKTPSAMAAPARRASHLTSARTARVRRRAHTRKLFRARAAPPRHALQKRRGQSLRSQRASSSARARLRHVPSVQRRRPWRPAKNISNGRGLSARFGGRPPSSQKSFVLSNSKGARPKSHRNAFESGASRAGRFKFRQTGQARPV
jgi:hypothetical protein